MKLYELKMMSYEKYRQLKGNLQVPFGVGFLQISPSSMGRDTADDIVHYSKTKGDLRKAVKIAKKESQLSYMNDYHKEYYSSLIRELKSYLKYDENRLDLYRIKWR